MVDVGATREIEVAINGSLSRKGVGGTVVVRGNTAELHGAGPVVAIDLGDWVDQWNLLPPDMRDRRADVAAERLRSSVQDVGGSKGSATPSLFSSAVVKVVGVVILVGSIGGGGYWLYRSNFFGEPKETAGAPDGSSREVAPPMIDPALRAKKVCEAGRSRIYAGASIAMDVEGWIVELWLARAGKGPLHSDPGLLKLSQTEQLNAAFGTKSAGKVEVVDATLEKLGGSAAMLRFSGGFVEPFLGTKGRQRFIDLLGSLADATDADYAALFARCAHLKVRDIGAYYRGRDAAGAAAALLYAQGAFSDPKVVDVDKLDGEWLKALKAATTAVDDKSLLDLTRKVGARLVTVGQDAGVSSVSLRFVLGGPTRAQSASRLLAGQLGLR